ncbi:MAG: hypothetical protein FWF84_04380 [Kiritimatiellaeota bacterium]|nr:hypothetical protein [Kiritimatiellota bacterium]
MKKPSTPPPRTWYHRTVRLIAYSLQFITACAACGAGLGAGFAPAGLFDSATYSGGWLENGAWDDSRYEAPLAVPPPAPSGSAFLDIEVAVRVAESNAVWVAFGDGFRIDLRIGCEQGRWFAMAGDDARPFDCTWAQGALGERTLRLTLQTSPGGRILGASASDGGAFVSPPEAWRDIDPSRWDRVEASLRGTSAALGAITLSRRQRPSLIIIR